MIRGTTPTLIFTFPFEVDSIQKMWLTFSQNDKEVFTIDKDRCELSERKVTVTLTQEQTLQLINNAQVEIQFRVLTYNSTALASNILKLPVQRILKGGVI